MAAGTAAVLAVLEVIDAFRIDRPVFALVLAALFALGAVLVWRGGRWAAILIALPALVDLVGVLSFYGPPESSAETNTLIAFGVLSALALVASLWRLARPTEQPT